MTEEQKTEEPKKVKVDMIQSRIPPHNKLVMDEFTKKFRRIHELAAREIGERALNEKNPEIQHRIAYELALATTHAEDSLTRFCRAVEHCSFSKIELVEGEKTNA